MSMLMYFHVVILVVVQWLTERLNAATSYKLLNIDILLYCDLCDCACLH